MNVDLLIEPLQVLLRQAGEFLPRLALAVVVLIAGWLFAKAVRFAVVRGLRAINLNVLTERAGMDGFLAQGGINTDTTGIFGVLVYWLVILAFGAYFARFVGGTIVTYCRNVGVRDADLLGKVAQYALIVFVVLIALDQMSVGGDIVRQSFLILLAGAVFGLALAFGIGGKDWAAGLLEQWWPRRGPKDPQ